MNTTQHTLKTFAAVAVAAPLLAGCGQGGQSAEASTPATSSATSAAASSALAQSPAEAGSAAPASSAAPGDVPTGAPSATASPSSAGADGTALPTVADPCAATCRQTARVPVRHPTLGAVEIVSYELVTVPDGAPQGKQASYALYQNGRAVGYVASPPSSEVISFGLGPVLGDQLWDIAGAQPVDRYGNVYFSDNDGITVISPTDLGYDSHGTMPGAAHPAYPFHRAGVKIDAAGEPTVVARHVDDKGMDTGKTVDWTWNGGKFVAQK